MTASMRAKGKSRTLMVTIVTLTAIVAAVWVWKTQTAAAKDRAKVRAVYRQYEDAVRSGNGNAMAQMSGPASTRMCERILRWAASDSRVDLREREVDDQVVVLYLRSSYSKLQLQRMKPSEGLKFLFADKQPDKNPPKLKHVEVQGDVVWAAIDLNIDGFKPIEGEFFTRKSGQWMFEPMAFGKVVFKAAKPGMKVIDDPELIETVVADQTGKPFESALWEGPRGG